jgi:hypothetical protein
MGEIEELEPTTALACRQMTDFGADPQTVTVTTWGSVDVERFARMNRELAADPWAAL